MVTVPDWRSWQATVLSVTDGDTVKVDVDLGRSVYGLPDTDIGFYVHTVGRRATFRMDIRLNGLNCPEKDTVAGVAAKRFTEKMLPVGAVVELHTIKVPYGDKREKYGRFLGIFFHQPTLGAQSLNEALVAQGYALPWDGHGLRPV